MSNEHVKATIQVGDSKVTFEGPQEFVEAQVAKYTSASTSKLQAQSSGIKNEGAPGSVSERELVAEKRPKGHVETVAVLAFALTENGMEEFTEEDIRRAYLRAGVRPPKVVAQALRDAKNLRDFIEAGSKKGMYRLSHHGDRTVRFDLPGSGKGED